MTATFLCVRTLAAAGALAVLAGTGPDVGQQDRNTQDGEMIRAAMLRYGTPPAAGQCFGTRFLQLVATNSTIKVLPEFDSVQLDSPQLLEHPFAVMSGEGTFTLSDAEVARLRTYLLRGGFLLATAGCSSGAWQGAFERSIERAFPGAPVPALGAAAEPGGADHRGAGINFGVHWKQLAPTHELFHTLFDVNELTTRPPAAPGAEPRIMALEIDGRIACVYSPGGLNDTHSAPGNADAGSKGASAPACCCCGTVEIVPAPYINADVLVYAVTH